MRAESTTDTSAWVFQAWAAFAIALLPMTVGIYSIDVDPWVKAFLGTGLYFTVSSTLALAKTVRDRHEANKLLSRIDEAKAERVLREYSEVA